MKKYAILKEPVPMNNYGDLIKKIMLYSRRKEGVYLFLYTTVDEYGQCCADHWFDDLQFAEDTVREEYGVGAEDWVFIDDPLPHCQHDSIHPVRVKGRIDGNPIWGELEIFNGTEWIDFTPSTE